MSKKIKVRVHEDVEVDLDVELSIEDILDNLHKFGDEDLRKLDEEISFLLFKPRLRIIQNPSNLLDEQKIEILERLMELHITQLEEIDKKYV